MCLINTPNWFNMVIVDIVFKRSEKMLWIIMSGMRPQGCGITTFTGLVVYLHLWRCGWIQRIRLT